MGQRARLVQTTEWAEGWRQHQRGQQEDGQIESDSLKPLGQVGVLCLLVSPCYMLGGEKWVHEDCHHPTARCLLLYEVQMKDLHTYFPWPGIPSKLLNLIFMI